MEPAPEIVEAVANAMDAALIAQSNEPRSNLWYGGIGFADGSIDLERLARVAIKAYEAMKAIEP